MTMRAVALVPPLGNADNWLGLFHHTFGVFDFWCFSCAVIKKNKKKELHNFAVVPGRPLSCNGYEMQQSPVINKKPLKF